MNLEEVKMYINEDREVIDPGDIILFDWLIAEVEQYREAINQLGWKLHNNGKITAEDWMEIVVEQVLDGGNEARKATSVSLSDTGEM